MTVIQGGMGKRLSLGEGTGRGITTIQALVPECNGCKGRMEKAKAQERFIFHRLFCCQ